MSGGNLKVPYAAHVLAVSGVGENEVVEVADFPDEARASDVDDETQNGILTAAAAAAAAR